MSIHLWVVNENHDGNNCVRYSEGVTFKTTRWPLFRKCCCRTSNNIACYLQKLKLWYLSNCFLLKVFRFKVWHTAELCWAHVILLQRTGTYTWEGCAAPFRDTGQAFRTTLAAPSQEAIISHIIMQGRHVSTPFENLPVCDQFDLQCIMDVISSAFFPR